VLAELGCSRFLLASGVWGCSPILLAGRECSLHCDEDWPCSCENDSLCSSSPFGGTVRVDGGGGEGKEIGGEWWDDRG